MAMCFALPQNAPVRQPLIVNSLSGGKVVARLQLVSQAGDGVGSTELRIELLQLKKGQIKGRQTEGRLPQRLGGNASLMEMQDKPTN